MQTGRQQLIFRSTADRTINHREDCRLRMEKQWKTWAGEGGEPPLLTEEEKGLGKQ